MLKGLVSRIFNLVVEKLVLLMMICILLFFPISIVMIPSLLVNVYNSPHSTYIIIFNFVFGIVMDADVDNEGRVR